MAFADHEKREINCKVVYYGPALGGKTTNIRYIHESTAASKKGKLISLATDTDRTLFTDILLPIQVHGYNLRIHPYALAGAVFYNASRRHILKGADGIVFVADSQPERHEANVETLWNLDDNLSIQGYDLLEMPYVLQLNKRDLPGVMNVEDLAKDLRRKDEPVVEAVAYKGIGIPETFNSVVNQIVEKLKTRDINDYLPPSFPKPIEVLVAALQTATEADERAKAAIALGTSAAEQAVDPLIGALKDESSVVRIQAVRALGKIDNPAGFNPLCRMLRDPDPVVRAALAEALAGKNKSKTFSLLAKLLRDESLTVRLKTVESLWLSHDKRIVPTLIETLRDEKAEVRSKAAETLGRVEDQRAVEPLEQLLGDPDSTVRETVVTALRRLRMRGRVSERDIRRNSRGSFFKKLLKRLRP